MQALYGIGWLQHTIVQYTYMNKLIVMLFVICVATSYGLPWLYEKQNWWQYMIIQLFVSQSSHIIKFNLLNKVNVRTITTWLAIQSSKKNATTGSTNKNNHA